MKIKKAKVIGFGRIEFEQVIQPDSDIIVLTGPNAQGKTSFLNAISSVFEGAASLPPIPINVKAKEAIAEVTLDNGLTLTRKINPKGGASFEIRDASGKSLESPQKFIEKQLKLFSLDPRSFAESDDAAQAKMAKRVIAMVVGSDMSPIQDYLNRYEVTPAAGASVVDAIDALIADNKGPVYMRRRDLAREVKTLSSVADAATDNGGDADLEGLRNNSEMAANRVSQSEDAIKIATGMAEDAENALAGLRTAKLKLASARGRMLTEPQNKTILAMFSATDEIEAAIKKLTEGHDYLVTAVIPQQKQGLEKFRSELQEFSKALGAAEARSQQAASLKESVAKYRQACADLEGADADLKELRSLRETIIANAKFPVEGLSVDGDTVMVGGLPFSQASQAQRLIISIKLAMAMNPELRVMRIVDGNALDAKTFNSLREIVEENDFQLWIEKVSDEPNGIGYYFEAGEIAYTPAEAPAAEKPKAKKATKAAPAAEPEQGNLL